MIQQGQMTIIDSITYRCLKIDEQGYAHLKNIMHEQGRPKLVLQKYCPYITKDGDYVVPEKPVYQRPKPSTKINVSKLIRDNIDLPITNEAKFFITEWVETAIMNLMANAEENAINRGDSRITAAHFYWLETNTSPNGYWPDNSKYMQD
tara:strand:+ start:718 stop:1164 length:447 start_codon:yes stop_codon:yes gene_type:complete